MNSLYKTLYNKKIYIISPHFDDAALSCGQLLHDLKGKADITVINIFTSAHDGPYTLSARKFLKTSSGSESATGLALLREREDLRALSAVGAKVKNLGFVDAIYRTSKNSHLGKIIADFDHLYPTYRWHVLGNINPKDSALERLNIRLQEFNAKDVIAIAPFGIGGHVDHLIAREVSENVFKNIIFYFDFPYSLKKTKIAINEKKYTKFLLKVDLRKKAELIQKYKSQFKNLFPDQKIVAHQEVYLITKNGNINL